MKSDWLILVILLALIGGGAWHFSAQREEPTETSTPEKPEPETAESTGPSHPMPPALTLRSRSVELVVLPPLDDSDSYFALADADSDRGFTLSQENFERYDVLIEMLATADVAIIVESYQRYYPLMQQPYESLGNPDGYFNERTVEVIDHLLETPDVELPIRLVRPHVFYEYADPDLEALSSEQKLLLRVGPENPSRIKQLLREPRSRTAAS